MASSPIQKPTEAWFEDTWWWKIKLHLQWTGWLQYMPNLLASLVMLLLAGAGALVGVWQWVTVGLPLVISVVLFANLVFDIATVRYGLHPAEPLPAPRSAIDTLDLPRARVSCRSFQNTNLNEGHRKTIMDLAETQSRPENLIGSHPIRFEYIAAPLNVWPVVGAREFLVAITQREYHELAVVDVGRSLQNVVLEATRMGLATCWIGPGANPDSIAKHLGARFDPAKDHVICVCAIGYASRYKPFTLRLMQRSQRWRRPLSELFFSNPALTKPLNVSIEPYAAFEPCYEACQWSPSSYNGQTTRAFVVAQSNRLERVDFCAATNSRYYAMVALGIWLANWDFGCRALGIGGHFEVASDDKIERPKLPRYVISWFRDDEI